MELWEVTSFKASCVKVTAQTTKSTSGGASDYAKILADALADTKIDDGTSAGTGLLEVTNFAASFVSVSAQMTYTNTAGDLASEYSNILAEKISNIETDVRKMDAVRERLDEISALHEELTGEVKIDKDSGNANRNGGSSRRVSVETVKHFLPDGTIMLTTYEDGRIVERVKLKPHMTVVPDYNAPPTPDGTVATKLEPTRNFYQSLLMV